MFDDSSAVWIVHSIPHGPLMTDKPTWFPPNGHWNGQSAFCVTLPVDAVNHIAEELYYMNVCYYWFDLTDQQQKQYPLLVEMHTNEVQPQSPPWNRTNGFTTASGQRVLHAAKAREWGEDLYSDWLSELLGADLVVQSWQNGQQSNRIPSNCTSTYTVLLFVYFFKLGIVTRNLV